MRPSAGQLQSLTLSGMPDGVEGVGADVVLGRLGGGELALVVVATGLDGVDVEVLPVRESVLLLPWAITEPESFNC